MLPWSLGYLLCLPYCLGTLTLDQKINLKLIESLWQEGQYALAEEKIDQFLTQTHSATADTDLIKLKADLLIKKKEHAQALSLLNSLNDQSNFTKERKLLCLYELKDWPSFLKAFEQDPSILQLPFGQKIWDLGLAQAIQAEQNLDKKQALMKQAASSYAQDLKAHFDQTKALSLALIYEDQKDYKRAYQLYDDLFINTHDDTYQLCMAKMASHFDLNQALHLLEPLRWKLGPLGTSAALFAMELAEKKQDFNQLYTLSHQELKLAPEGYRKGKIALYHLKSLYHLKCFDRICEFYNVYTPHKTLKAQDQLLAITLFAKTLIIKNELDQLSDFYLNLKQDQDNQSAVCAGRLLAKEYLEHHNLLKAQTVLEELLSQDPLHKDEYLTALGLCFFNTQAYEVAQTYFVQVLKESPQESFKKRALSYLIQLPSLKDQTLEQLLCNLAYIDFKTCPKALYWAVQALIKTDQIQTALQLIHTHGDEKDPLFHRLLGDLTEKHNPAEAISHFEKALLFHQEEHIEASLHGKLFNLYFEHDKDIAADHLFQSINLYIPSISEEVFDSLAAHLYRKAFAGVKLYLHTEETKKAASQLVRLLSYKPKLNDQQITVYGKTLRRLHRYEEAEKILSQAHTYEQKLEKAKVAHHLGHYKLSGDLLEELIQQKPYTLYLEGQLALQTKIRLDFEKIKALTDPTLSIDEVTKNLRILSVCIQNPNSQLAFETAFLNQVILGLNQQGLELLKNHPFLKEPSSGTHRKILNFLINQKLDPQSALTIDEPLSETMEWILIQSFGTCS